MKTDNSYEIDLLFEKLEVCKIFNGATSTPFLNSAVDWVLSINKNIVNMCNMIGTLSLLNMTIGESPFMIFVPNGHFIANYRLYDAKDANIFNVTFWTVVTR